MSRPTPIPRSPEAGLVSAPIAPPMTPPPTHSPAPDSSGGLLVRPVNFSVPPMVPPLSPPAVPPRPRPRPVAPPPTAAGASVPQSVVPARLLAPGTTGRRFARCRHEVPQGEIADPGADARSVAEQPEPMLAEPRQSVQPVQPVTGPAALEARHGGISSTIDGSLLLFQ
ncbi:hypothetical protein U0070_004274 [Myodes glareolus]|uniref:Uncharacterized protein n=1 Tax=Myodes glareolus TaxID=447135 RepID=A0AAW0HSV0_MYOGA